MISDILQDDPDTTKIIACIDLECDPKEEIEQAAKKIEKSLTAKVGRPVNYVVVEHALEEWLLADPKSINDYLKAKIRIDIPHSAAWECKPKEVMKDIFKKADKNRNFRHTLDNPKIAEKLDIDTAGGNSKSFAEFVNTIKDP